MTTTAPRTRPTGGWHPPILLYHGVSGNTAPGFERYDIDPGAFAEHLDAIADAGYRTVTMREMVDQMEAPPAERDESCLAITFDDGFRDFNDHALPLLQERGMSSTIYITTGYVGATSGWLEAQGEADRPMLSWDDIAAFGDDVEVGAHTDRHPMLDTVSRRRARDEIATSKRRLEEATGGEVESFAYPHGYSDAAVRRLVAEAGFRSATLANHAIATCDEDRFRISRIVVEAGAGADDVLEMIDTIPEAPPRERMRTKAWRTVRRARTLAGR